ncbi:hypothetical protein [Halomarina rubra]|uniref:DUF7847 domain-containing protein n=1 Tax=Halomarina rubra TaxID=2071873 RepID=A0ABD6ATC8_9EURY|nr:hypothetical protein [Halomarina rubra]
MSIPVLNTAERGIRRAVTRNGLAFMGILFVIGLLSALLDVGIASLVTFDPADPTSIEVAAPAFGLGVLSFLLGVLSLVVIIAATRVFVSDDTETVPREAFTRRMGWAWLNVFVGTIVYAFVVALGFVAFVIPGFFLLVALAFWTVFVAVEDENLLTAMRRSWGLTRGNRLSLFALGVVAVLVSIGVGIAFGLVSIVGGPVELVLTQASSAITTVLGLAILTTAYRTLTTEDEEPPEAPTADPDVPGAGASGGL